MKRNLLVDKDYIVGTSKPRRRPLDQAGLLADFYGHPCLPSEERLSHSPTADYFRLLTGNYWGFKEGQLPADYANFGFLVKNMDLFTGTTSMAGLGEELENLIHLKVASINRVHIPYTVSGPNSSLLQLNTWMDNHDARFLFRFFGSQALGYGSNNAGLAGAANSEQAGNMGLTIGDQTWAPGLYLSTVNLLKLKTSWSTWMAGSVYANIDSANPLSTPATYGKVPYLMGDPGRGSQNPGWQGPFGLADENNQSFAGPLYSAYLDHAHVIWTPYLSSSPALANSAGFVKTARVSAEYRYSNIPYEDLLADGGSAIDSRLIPNSYMLLQAIDYNPANTLSTPPGPEPQPPTVEASLVGAYNLAMQQLTSMMPFRELAEALDEALREYQSDPDAQGARQWIVTILQGGGELSPSGTSYFAPPPPLTIPQGITTEVVAAFFGQTVDPVPPPPPITFPPDPENPPFYGITAEGEAQEVGTPAYDTWLYDTIIRPALAILEAQGMSEAGLEKRERRWTYESALEAAALLADEDPVTVVPPPAPPPTQAEAEVIIMNAAQGYLSLIQSQYASSDASALSTIGQYQQAEADLASEMALYTTAINSYNAIVAQVNANNDQILGSRMYGLYRFLLFAGIGGSAALPTSREQVREIPYTDSNGRSATYMERLIDALGSPYSPNLIKKRLSHIGFSEDFMKTKLAVYNETQGIEIMPFSISIRFDTNFNETNYLGTRMETENLLQGAYDFFLHNIMLANIVQPGQLDDTVTFDGFTYNSNTGLYDNPIVGVVEPDFVYNNESSFATKIEDVNAGNKYSGFDWVLDPPDTAGGTPTAGIWGANTPAGQQASAGDGNLRIIDVPAMFAYCAQLVNSITPIASINRGSFVTDPGTGNTAWVAATTGAPNPLVGQFKDNGTMLAFGQGFFLGNTQLNFNPDNYYQQNPADSTHTWPWRSHVASNKLVYEGIDAENNLVIPSTRFKKLCIAVADLIEEKQRTFEDILNGELAYSEIIAFKIDKHLVDSQGAINADPIQSFYFPNLPSAAHIQYVDSQIKFGQPYKYKVYAYTLVVGDCYNYNNGANKAQALQSAQGTTAGTYNGLSAGNALQDLWTSDPTAPFYVNVNQWPSVKIIEELYCEFDPISVIDLPPVFPEVRVVPFLGSSDKIRFLLQRQEVQYTINPDNFIINSSDIDIYNETRISQQKPTGPLLFGSDNVETIYEIYRTETKPNSYQDFSGKLIATVEGRTPRGKIVTEVAYDDTNIVPNRKYYYTFRSVDPRGALSIPTHIYEIELVDNNGMIFPIIDVIYVSPSPLNASAEPTPLTTTTKPLRKFLQIETSFAQQAVNISPTAGPMGLDPHNPPPLGLLNTQSPSVWTTGTPTAVGNTPKTNEKVFKIRVRSKQTGKKFDLNVRFVENPIANPIKQD